MQKKDCYRLKKRLVQLGAVVAFASVMSTTTVQAKSTYQNSEIDLVRELGIANADGIIKSLREKQVLGEGSVSSVVPIEYLQELTYLNYYGHMNGLQNDEDFAWLSQCSHVETISFSNVSAPEIKKVLSIIKPKKIDQVILSGLSNKETNAVLKELQGREFGYLEIAPKTRSQQTLDDCKVDFSLLHYAKEVTICGDLYDLPIVFTQADIDLLNKKGISITYQIKGGSQDDLLKVEKDLEQYCEEIGILDTDSDFSKISRIMNFVMNKYTYSEKIASMTEEELDEYDHSEFYDYGYLRANYQSEQICGNYAALLNALAIRFGLDSWILSGYRHAYNIIKTGKDYNIYDATWSDHDILDDNDIDWFCYSLQHDEFSDEMNNHFIEPDLYSSIEKEIVKSYGISVEDYRRGLK